jgi:LmbE family N-acetylglucosaminyl deacetylase
MLSLEFKDLRTVLCLGAHADDIEIGCGGTILKLLRERAGLNFVWVVFNADGRRAREARFSALEFLQGAGKRRILVKDFRNSFFPFEGVAIKEFFEQLKGMVQPDLVFTHYRDDRHQDHRVLSDLAWNSFRDHLILEYVIPKYDGDLVNPNFFVRLDQDLCRRKVEHLCAFFQTQRNKHWFSEDLFLGLMRIRGMECAAPTNYAEAFYCRKLVV